MHSQPRGNDKCRSRPLKKSDWTMKLLYYTDWSRLLQWLQQLVSRLTVKSMCRLPQHYDAFRLQEKNWNTGFKIYFMIYCIHVVFFLFDLELLLRFRFKSKKNINIIELCLCYLKDLLCYLKAILHCLEIFVLVTVITC